MARRYIRPRLTDQAGNVLEGALLRVLEAGTSTTVDLYAASSGGSVLSQPRSTDARGEVEAWLADGTGDIDLEWSADPGVTTVAATGRTSTFQTFTEFVEAPSGGGGGVSTHAGLPDLATSGHPASVISGLGGAATKDVGTIAGTVAAGDDSRITGALAAATAAATYQPLDSDLTAIAALATTVFGRALLTLADAAAGRTSLGLGTAATESAAAFDAAGAAAAAQAASQPLDSDLTAIAALSTTAYGRAFLALADASAARTALSLGGAAVLNVGTTAGTVAAGDDPRFSAGGGGGGAAPITRTGFYSYPLGDISLAGTFSLANDCACYVPFEVAEGRAFDRIGLQMHWSGPQADTLVRLGIYENDDGDPGALVLDAGTVDTSTTGTKEITIAETLTPGLYWLAAAHQGVGTGTVVMIGTGSVSPIPAPSTGYLAQNNGGWKDAAGPAGALPDPAVISSRDLYSVIPRLFLRGA